MKKYIFLIVGLIIAANSLHAQKNKNIDHTFLGVDVDNISDEANGLFVNGVYKGFGAEKAGIRSGDTLWAVNTEKVNSFGELVNTLDKYKPGEEVELTISRNNSMQKIKATLSPYPEFLKYTQHLVSQEGSKATLGIQVEPDWSHYGVKVTGFENDSPTGEGGLQKDDILLGMDNYQFATWEELHYYLSKYSPGDKVQLKVIREGSEKTIPVTLGKSMHQKYKEGKEEKKWKEKKEYKEKRVKA